MLLALPLGAAAGLAAVAIEASAPQFALLAPAAIAVVWLGVSRPFWALYLGVAAVPLEVLAQSYGQAFFLTPAEGLLLAAAGGWLFQRMGSLEKLEIAPALTGGVALLIASTIPGLLVAEDPLLTLKQLAMWSAFFVLFLMVSADGDEKVLRNTMIALAISGGLVGLSSLIVDPVGAGGGRAVGPFSQPNTLAFFLAITLPAQAALALRGPPALRPFMVASGAAAVLGLVLTLSRGTWIGVLVAVGMMMFWRPFRRVAVVAIAAVVLILASGIDLTGDLVDEQSIVDRVVETGDSSSEPVALRADVYSTAPRIVADHPLFGVGAVNFPSVAADYNLLHASFTTPQFGGPHNFYLHIATTRGVIGLAAMIWVGIALGAALVMALRRLKGELHWLALTFTGTLLSVAVIGLTHDPVNANVIMGVLFILVGCVGVLRRLALADEPVPSPDAEPDRQEPPPLPGYATRPRPRLGPQPSGQPG